MLSVELVPDAAVDAAVRADWARLDAAGLPHAGRNPSPSNRPHLTLAVRDHLDIAALAGVQELLPLPLHLGGIVLFRHSRRVVVARQVVVSAALLRLHHEIAERLGAPEPRYANTGRDRWTPHVTLARSVPIERLGEVLQTVAAPEVEGAATGLRVWDAAAKIVTTLA
ncbi:2'-5' RNA ligase family protein [Microbacterium sp. NPDC057407]|uniref:2'-5' RNA ligase family protein n=1 Tax=Microbacterium sp. NPDC057407 TaxID=3346120 RepID=UPI0036728825